MKEINLDMCQTTIVRRGKSERCENATTREGLCGSLGTQQMPEATLLASSSSCLGDLQRDVCL